MPALSQSDIERFEQRFQKTSDCWEWSAGLFEEGYGQFRLNGQPIGAHVVSYYLYVQPVWSTREQMVLHSCNNKRCVNPAHLRLGTNSQNQKEVINWESKKVHCPKGHPYSLANTYYKKGGKGRRCRTCAREGMRRGSG